MYSAAPSKDRGRDDAVAARPFSIQPRFVLLARHRRRHVIGVYDAGAANCGMSTRECTSWRHQHVARSRCRSRLSRVQGILGRPFVAGCRPCDARIAPKAVLAPPGDTAESGAETDGGGVPVHNHIHASFAYASGAEVASPTSEAFLQLGCSHPRHSESLGGADVDAAARTSTVHTFLSQPARLSRRSLSPPRALHLPCCSCLILDNLISHAYLALSATTGAIALLLWTICCRLMSLHPATYITRSRAP